MIAGITQIGYWGVESISENAIRLTIPAVNMNKSYGRILLYIPITDARIQNSTGFLSNLIAGAGNVNAYDASKTTEWDRHVRVNATLDGGWIRVAGENLSDLTDNEFVLYANPNQVADYDATDPHGRHAAYDQYSGAWDMENDPAGAAPQVPDLTAGPPNGPTDGTTQGSMVSGDQGTSPYGWKYYNFELSQYIDCGYYNKTSGPVPGGNDDVYFEFWARWTNPSSMQLIGATWNSNPNKYGVHATAGGGIHVDVRHNTGGGINQNSVATGLNDGEWHHIGVQVRRDSPSGQGCRIVIDGVLDTETGHMNSTWMMENPTFLIGARNLNTGVPRNTSWDFEGDIGPSFFKMGPFFGHGLIELKYQNETDFGNFVSDITEETF